MRRRVASGMCVFGWMMLAGLTSSDGVAQRTPASASIRPQLTYSTYFGKPADRINALAVGPDGSLYLAGVTLTNPGRIDATQWSAGGGKPFVAHVSPDGTKLLYFTLLSNGTGDEARAIAVDATGNAYVTGQTREQAFPVRHALQARCSLDRAGKCLGEAFVAKVNPQGSLVFATYLGGSGEDAGNAIAVDGRGNIYVAGSTTSVDFPKVSPVQGVPGGGADAFAAKIAADGSHVVYATYLGGTGFDEARGIAVDGVGNAYVTGTTESPDFPNRNALQSRCVWAERGGCAGEAFVAKLSAEGSAILYSTYLGGSGGDSGAAITVDAGGNAYVAGVTSSIDFPLARPVQPALAGTSNAFVSVISAEGSELTFSTYLGGSSFDQARAIAMDPAGNVVVSGWAHSGDFPMVDAVQNACQNAAHECSVDAFVSVLDASEGKLVFSSYLGGSGTDVSQATAVGRQGTAYVGGWTNSKDLPRVGMAVASPGRVGNGWGGSFLAKIDGILRQPSTVYCQSETNNWTGGAGDNKWASKGNWSLGRVPISSDSVCIASSFSASTITISSLASVNQIISALSGAASILFTGGPLTISGSADFYADTNMQSGVLTLNDFSNMETFELSGGTLTGAGTLFVSGLLTWSGGAMCSNYSTSAKACAAPTQGPSTTDANGGLALPSGSVTLNGRLLNNAGTATVSGESITLLNSATIRNRTGATWNQTSNANITVGDSVSPIPRFNNDGTLTQTAGSGVSTIQAVFNNTGAVQVNKATLDLVNGGVCNATCPGTWTVASGATLQFDTPPTQKFALSGAMGGTGSAGAGAVNFASGNEILSGNYNISGGTTVNTATVNFNGTVSNTGALTVNSGVAVFATTSVVTVTVPAMTLNGGTLAANDSFTVTGLLTWSGGSMCTVYTSQPGSCAASSTPGTTTAGGGISFGAGNAILDSRILNNTQTATMTSAISLNLLDSATVNNKSGATWNLAADANLYGFTGTFNNSGTFEKTGGTSTTLVQPVFNHTGTVLANAATLDFNGGGTCILTCSGTWSVASAGSLQFDTAAYSLSGKISGAGTITFGSGTETLTGAYSATGITNLSGAIVGFNQSAPVAFAGPVNLTNGYLYGSATLNLNGLLTWTYGVMCTAYSQAMASCTIPGVQAVTNANGGVILPSGYPVLNARILNNIQTATMSGDGYFLNLLNNAVLNNKQGATWNLAADASLSGPSGTFNNAGTFSKTLGTTSTIQTIFTNAGAVQAGSGTLAFLGAFTQSGGSSALNGGNFSWSLPVTFAAGSLTGSGTVNGAVVNASAVLAPGSSTVAGAIAFAGASSSYTQNLLGSYNVKVGGTGAGQFDQITVGGATVLTGALNVSKINGYSPPHGSTFKIITSGSVTGAFTKVTSGWKVTYNKTSVVLTFP
jgi:phage baseplate assembly protein gpV